MSVSPKRRIRTIDSADLIQAKRCKTSDGVRDPLKTLDRNLRPLSFGGLVDQGVPGELKSISVPQSPVLKPQTGRMEVFSPGKRGPSCDSYLVSPRAFQSPRAPKVQKNGTADGCLLSTTTTATTTTATTTERQGSFEIFSDTESSTNSARLDLPAAMLKVHQTLSAATDPPVENIPPFKRPQGRSNPTRQRLKDLDIQLYPGYVCSASSRLAEYQLTNPWHENAVSRILYGKAHGPLPAYTSPPRRRPTSAEVKVYIGKHKSGDVDAPMPVYLDKTPFVVFEDEREYNDVEHSPLRELDLEMEDKENAGDEDIRSLEAS